MATPSDSANGAILMERVALPIASLLAVAAFAYAGVVWLDGTRAAWPGVPVALAALWLARRPHTPLLRALALWLAGLSLLLLLAKIALLATGFALS